MIFSADYLVNNGIIIPNDKGAKAQVGYDITVKEIRQILRGGSLGRSATKIESSEVKPDAFPYTPSSHWVSDPDDRYVYELSRGAYSVTFDQGCNLPNGVCGWLRHRSSLARIGCTLTSGIYDPGFFCDNIGGILTVNVEHVVIERGARIAQFIAMSSQDSELYDGQYQGSKDIK